MAWEGIDATAVLGETPHGRRRETIEKPTKGDSKHGIVAGQQAVYVHQTRFVRHPER